MRIVLHDGVGNNEYGGKISARFDNFEMLA